jgi:hypothetical protein
MTKAQYLKYLNHTLIPDLRESGRDFMANDFDDLARLVSGKAKHAHHDGRSASEFVYYLNHTLIPDLYESGSEEMANDFVEGIKLLKKKSSKRKR